MSLSIDEWLRARDAMDCASAEPLCIPELARTFAAVESHDCGLR